MDRPCPPACPCADRGCSLQIQRSWHLAALVPFKRSFPPLIYEADREHGKKDHHRPVAVKPEIAKGDRPGKQEADLEVEDDEQNRDEIEAHIEWHARVVER